MKLLICWITVILFAGAAGAGTQDKATKPAALLPSDCEANIAALSAANHDAGQDGLVIAIARLGDGESRRELNRRRLHNVRVYLTEFDWKRDPKTLILAEGERVKGYGRVELYVKGMQYHVLAVKRNGDLLVGSCEPDDIRPKKAEENLYPYLDRAKRRKQQRSQL
jgi:hypothetical protein